MSSFHIIGCFELTKGSRAPPQQNGKPSLYAHYVSSIQCKQHQSLPADIRVYTPPHASLFPDDTVIFLIAKGFVTTMAYLDVIIYHEFPGDPSSGDYQDYMPNFPYPYVSGLGHVSSSAPILADAGKSFGLNIGEFVRGDTRVSNVICAYDVSSPRFKNTPMPSLNSCVHILGICHSIPDSHLCIMLEDITLNVGPHAAAAPQQTLNSITTASASPSKRKKFNAVAPPTNSLLPALPAIMPALQPAVPPLAVPDSEPSIVTLENNLVIPSIKAPVFTTSDDTVKDTRIVTPSGKAPRKIRIPPVPKASTSKRTKSSVTADNTDTVGASSTAPSSADDTMNEE